jgi:hypothetical protein
VKDKGGERKSEGKTRRGKGQEEEKEENDIEEEKAWV